MKGVKDLMEECPDILQHWGMETPLGYPVLEQRQVTEP